MSEFSKNISFSRVSEAIEVAILELFPNFGKNYLPLILVKEPKFSNNYRNIMS